VLAVVGLATGWNLQGWPGRVNDDEGTYVAQAWAMLFPHHLSHYTYWYDHPPFGWAQIAGYIWATGGFARDASAVMAGREFMWLVTMITAGLLFVLCRRLGMRRVTAAFVVLLFGLSPLAVYFHRLVSLDNIGTMWLVAALTFAASPRRSLAAAFGSAVCMAGAVLSKETLLIMLPAVLWMLWQHTAARTRKWNFGIFSLTLVLLVAVYPLMALLRGELLPGRGHVSLGWALWWQFVGRSGGGSPLDPHSATYELVHFWLSIDPWLIVAGVVLIPLALLAVRPMRPVALALVLQVLVIFKGGYLPYFYVTAMLPFAALLIGGVADAFLGDGSSSRLGSSGGQWEGARGQWEGAWKRAVRLAGGGVVIAATLAWAVFVVPGWWSTLSHQSRVRGDAAELAATAWIEQHVSRHDVVVVDDYMWPDLKMDGWNPLWLWKTDSDPQVTREVLPHGYRSIQYVVLAPQAQSTLETLPTLRAALGHSELVRSFGGGLSAWRVVAG
jgi:hypothetical protein